MNLIVQSWLRYAAVFLQLLPRLKSSLGGNESNDFSLFYMNSFLVSSFFSAETWVNNYQPLTLLLCLDFWDFCVCFVCLSVHPSVCLSVCCSSVSRSVAIFLGVLQGVFIKCVRSFWPLQYSSAFQLFFLYILLSLFFPPHVHTSPSPALRPHTADVCEIWLLSALKMCKQLTLPKLWQASRSQAVTNPEASIQQQLLLASLSCMQR